MLLNKRKVALSLSLHTHNVGTATFVCKWNGHKVKLPRGKTNTIIINSYTNKNHLVCLYLDSQEEIQILPYKEGTVKQTVGWQPRASAYTDLPGTVVHLTAHLGVSGIMSEVMFQN